MKITSSNVDDYIRDRKRKGQKRFFWSGSDLKAFKEFAIAVFSDLLVGYPKDYFNFTHNSKGKIIDARPKRHFPNGLTFMGVKHFKKSL